MLGALPVPGAEVLVLTAVSMQARMAAGPLSGSTAAQHDRATHVENCGPIEHLEYGRGLPVPVTGQWRAQIQYSARMMRSLGLKGVSVPRGAFGSASADAARLNFTLHSAAKVCLVGVEDETRRSRATGASVCIEYAQSLFHRAIETIPRTTLTASRRLQLQHCG